MRQSRALCDGALPKGPAFFPIHRRVIDYRLAPDVAAHKAQVQYNHGKQRTQHTRDRALRQVEPPHWSAVRRPTHFLSLRLPRNSNLVHIYEVMRKHVNDEHRELLPLLVPPARLHVTLSVLSCGDQNSDPAAAEGEGAAPDAAIARAVEIVGGVLADTKPPPFTLTLSGLGTFSHGRVVVARVMAEKDATRLEKTVRAIRAALHRDAGVDIKGNPFDAYVPHVTLAKVRQHQREALNTRIVPPRMYRPFVEEHFGDHTFATLDLCAMRGAEEEDGYYPIVRSFSL